MFTIYVCGCGRVGQIVHDHALAGVGAMVFCDGDHELRQMAPLAVVPRSMADALARELDASLQGLEYESGGVPLDADHPGRDALLTYREATRA